MSGRLPIGWRIWFGICGVLAAVMTALLIYGGIVAIEWLGRH